MGFSDINKKSLLVSFADKLNDKDTEFQTYGCRYSNPDICGSNLVPDICAFVCEDHICKKPSKLWRKQYIKLRQVRQ